MDRENLRKMIDRTERTLERGKKRPIEIVELVVACSVTRLGDFLNVLMKKFLKKVAKIYFDFFSYIGNRHTLEKN